MMSRLAALAALALAAAACHPANQPAEPAPDAPTAAATTPAAPTSAAAAAAPSVAATAVEPRPPLPGAPAYAAIYPGGELDGSPTAASGSAGDGGLVTFTTEASPDAVVAFYKSRAEAAGLTSTLGMNQGDARAYGAAGAGADGASLQVVASPASEGETSVQLSWSEGG